LDAPGKKDGSKSVNQIKTKTVTDGALDTLHYMVNGGEKSQYGKTYNRPTYAYDSVVGRLKM